MAFNLTEVQFGQQNPLTPMAFLSPEDAYQATIATYVMIGSVGAFIWDILNNVDSDYKLLFRHRIGIPTMIYFLSRVGVLVYVLTNVIFQTATLSHCQAMQKTICALYHVAFSSTAMLFFFRVRAIFNQNKCIVGFFAILWLGVLGGSITVVTFGDAVHLGPTGYCISTEFRAYASAAPISFAVNDTFVFLAISWRLLSSATLRERKLGIRSIMLGEYLPAFSRALFQDGQVYYLVSVTSNIIVAVVAWVGAVPLSYRLFSVYNAVLTNMMACRVFRHTKFSYYREETISTRWIASQLANLDLDAGKGHVRRSSLTFVSFRTTENEIDDLNENSRENVMRAANVVLRGEAEKDSGFMGNVDPQLRGRDVLEYKARRHTITV